MRNSSENEIDPKFLDSTYGINYEAALAACRKERAEMFRSLLTLTIQICRRVMVARHRRCRRLLRAVWPFRVPRHVRSHAILFARR